MASTRPPWTMDGLRSSLSSVGLISTNITRLTISFFSVSKSSLIFVITSLNSFSVPSLGVKVGSLSINLSIVLVVSGMLLFTTTFCSTLFSLTQYLNQDLAIAFLIHLRVPNSETLSQWSRGYIIYPIWTIYHIWTIQCGPNHIISSPTNLFC